MTVGRNDLGSGFPEQDVFAAFDVGVKAGDYGPVLVGGDVEFGAGAEGDHADALAAGEGFSRGEGGDDAAGDGADDLFEDGGGGGKVEC